MQRLPPDLLYLVIYNPSLLPGSDVPLGDEDAEEQAHILFYTAKQQAISRDRMLRQVGLAKALVKFSEMFGAEGGCEAAHSQGKRMIMVSPEPDYWMHSCIELARSPQVKQDKNKSDTKGKERETTLDYHYGSLQDNAIRSYMLRGYEQFKLVYGTFSSILSSRGQQALELQLERFFTVWAWKWDMEDSFDFGAHLGVPLHPLHKSLSPVLDNFLSISTGQVSFVLAPPYLIPSARWTDARYPHSLPRHLISLFPPPRPPNLRRKSSKRSREGSSSTVTQMPVETTKGKSAQNGSHGQNVASYTNGSSAGGSMGTMNFLTMPNVNMNMDVRKWNWTGYLSFGKAQGKKSSDTLKGDARTVLEEKEESKDENRQAASGGHVHPNSVFRPPEVLVDPRDLEEAISSSGGPTAEASSLEESVPLQRHVSATSATNATDDHVEPHAGETVIAEHVGENVFVDHVDVSKSTQDPFSDSASVQASDSVSSSIDESSDDNASILLTELDANVESPFPAQSTVSRIIQGVPQTHQATSSPPPRQPSSLSSTNVFLPTADNPLAVERKKVVYFIHSGLMFGVITGAGTEGLSHFEDEGNSQALFDRGMEILQIVRETLENDGAKSLEASLPSATRIMQPKDRYIISTGSSSVLSSPDFKSTSAHLYDGERMLRTDPDVLEVFSRGQNPQHWHISRRGLGMDKKGAPLEGHVFMEVARKEASLTDVDNDLAGMIKRLLE